MVKIATLLKGHQRFYEEYFIKNPEVYQKLVEEGQAPKTLVIACSDSRVDPSIILDTKPGDIFVIRNVANLVPPYEHDEASCHGTSAAIEYAVKQLKVENIIVLGHSHCGGIKALIEDEENDHNFIDNWIYIAKEAKIKALKSSNNEEEICEHCEKEAIHVSLQNLMSFPFIKEKVQNQELELQGWYFSLEQGIIETIAVI